MITVSHLTKKFGKLTAVDDLSFTVQPGEVVALWGANGAGKTTVLRCLLNLMPFNGRITIHDQDIQKAGKSVRQQIGFVPQELTFHDDMTIDETMLFYALLRKLGYDYDTTPLLEQLALIPHRSKRVRDLSGGLKQRLALALALLSDPPILFLDEPTASLDVNARNDFLSLLLALKQAGKTMIFTSHRLEDMITLADRVLVLAQGQLQADCPPTQLTATWGRPSTLYLTIPNANLEPAAALLHQHGLIVNKNGHGLRVQVSPGARGEPLQLLHQAGIAVEDFEIEG